MVPIPMNNIKAELFSANSPTVKLETAYTNEIGVTGFSNLPVGEYIVHVTVPEPYILDPGNAQNYISDGAETPVDAEGDVIYFNPDQQKVYVFGIEVYSNGTSSVSLALAKGLHLVWGTAWVTDDIYRVWIQPKVSAPAPIDLVLTCNAKIKNSQGQVIAQDSPINLVIQEGGYISNMQIVTVAHTQPILNAYLELTNMVLSNPRMIVNTDNVFILKI